MKEFGLWKLCNMNNDVMINPFQRVALALSYIKGQDVDNWVSQQVDGVYHKVHGDPMANLPGATHQANDEALW